jgi:superfamily II DNA or RNA helicase
MDELSIVKKSESTLVIHSDDRGILVELSEQYSFFAEGYQWMPAYKMGSWDGKIRLFNFRSQTLPFGLLDNLLEFCKARGYKVNIDPNIKPRFTPNKEMVFDYCNSLPICDKNGDFIKPREYQLNCVWEILNNQRKTILSPTGSGKSLIIYLVMNWFLENIADSDEKCLIVVPTTSLVEQMYKDFSEYSLKDENFYPDEDSHIIYSGKDKDSDKSIFISTWQSIYKLGPKWFSQFSMVCIDEVHLAAAKSLSSIMEKLNCAYLRMGTTGTLSNDSQVNELTIEGHIGPVYKTTSTKQLMDDGDLAQLSIQALALKYDSEECKLVKKLTYAEEIKFITEHDKRNNFIRNLACDQDDRNILVMFKHIKHGKVLYDLIKEKKDKTVYYVSGETATEDRERIRQLTEKGKGVIIVASMGVFSTGINIKNLHGIIFASPTKSQIKVLQSIGRGLRKADNGEETYLFDLVDDFSNNKKKQNFALKHGIHRLKIYQKEKFNFKVTNVPLYK